MTKSSTPKREVYKNDNFLRTEKLYNRAVDGGNEDEIKKWKERLDACQASAEAA